MTAHGERLNEFPGLEIEDVSFGVRRYKEVIVDDERLDRGDLVWRLEKGDLFTGGAI